MSQNKKEAKKKKPLVHRPKAEDLCVAVRNGSVEEIGGILEKGIDINARNMVGSTALHFAVQAGRTEVVKFLLNHKADINAVDNYGRTALHLAVDSGNKDVVDLLLIGGALVNIPDNHNNLALHVAARKGHAGIVRSLLDGGATIDARNDEDFFPLHCAVERGHAEVLLRLLERGAAVDAMAGGATALHMAARRGDGQCIWHLLTHHADVTLLNSDGETAESIYGVDEMRRIRSSIQLRSFLSTIPGNVEKEEKKERKSHGTPVFPGSGNPGHHYRLDVSDEKIPPGDVVMEYLGGNLPVAEAKIDAAQDSLCEAAYSGDLERIKTLIKQGARINAPNRHGETPLYRAAIGRHWKAVNWFLTHGAQADVIDSGGWTLLHWAANANDPRAVRFLLVKGHVRLRRDYRGLTPLHEAARTASFLTLRVFLDSMHVDDRSFIDAQDSNGLTALHWAVHAKQHQNIKILLDAGAAIGVSDNRGLTALHRAARADDRRAARLLLDAGAVAHTEIEKEMVKKLGVKGASEREMDKLGKRIADDCKAKGIEGMEAVMHIARYMLNEGGGFPLHSSVMAGFEERVKVCLDDGMMRDCIDIDVQDYDGLTVLHRAVSIRHRGIVKSLLDRGARVNREDYDGFTALHHAVRLGDETLAKFLLDSKADIHAKDINGLTVLHWAVRRGDLALVSLLLNHDADIYAQEDDGATALNYASETTPVETVTLLMAHKEKVDARKKAAEEKVTSLFYQVFPPQAFGIRPPAERKGLSAEPVLSPPEQKEQSPAAPADPPDEEIPPMPPFDEEMLRMSPSFGFLPDDGILIPSSDLSLLPHSPPPPSEQKERKPEVKAAIKMGFHSRAQPVPVENNGQQPVRDKENLPQQEPVTEETADEGLTF